MHGQQCSMASIFKCHGPLYRASHALSVQKLRTMSAIELCRTDKLGGHVTRCDACGKIEQHYNSCRNRHCPGCQAVTTAKWLEARCEDLLPCQYFHVVFTLPHQLNTLANSNLKIIYGLLFRAAQETIKTLGHDSKRLDGEAGMISILHTWGQNLSQHIHTHCLIPGGALNTKLNKWNKSKRGFLFPVKVMSKLFRGIYVSLLREAYDKGELKCIGQSAKFSEPLLFDALLNELMKNPWVVYAKKPFAGPEQVLKYIGQYTHRIAISNHRILSCEDGKVRFKWRDYKDNNKVKIMTLSVDEFIRRFLQHVLPAGFVRIRYFGFMANACRKKKLDTIRKLMRYQKQKKIKTDTETTILNITGIDVKKCQHCKMGTLLTLLIVPRPTDTRKKVYWDTS